MTIKLIIFDLDGVLVSSKDMHYNSLNRALQEFAPHCVISYEDHLSNYDGLPTRKKLKLLTETKGLPEYLHDKIWNSKQHYTTVIVDQEYTYDERIRGVLKQLKAEGYTIHVASNCIYNSVKMILLRKGFMEYIDYFISNEQVNRSKPYPEMYQRCMIQAGVTCKETLIVEDSPVGIKAATGSGARVKQVDSPADVSIDLLLQDTINCKTTIRTSTDSLCYNVVIPMAGEGSRFRAAGYTFPKPLIDVHGKPMIQVVVENLNLNPKNCNFYFIVRSSHLAEYNISQLLENIAPGCTVIPTDGLTQGAACSILLAKEYINNDLPLILANSDQYMVWDSNKFIQDVTKDGVDGGIATFENNHPRWSYAKVDKDDYVTEVAEKNPISTHATTGIYCWKRGADFVKYAEQMIAKDVRVNGEFYTCPVFNEAISDGKKFIISNVAKMYGLGVPEDLEYYLKQQL